MSKRSLAWTALILAVLVFSAASLGMSRGIEPFFTWYYVFAWWPFIVALEASFSIKGRPSLLFDQPWDFVFLALLSIPLWCVFEVFNFRLDNWAYLGAPANAPLRWLGYALGYATVLPALGAAEQLLLAAGFENLKPGRRIRISKRLDTAVTLSGAVLLTLALALPRYAFPLVWLGFIPLLDPLLRRRAQDSLLRFLEQGFAWRVGVMALAGGLCGLLWETWNFHAGAKWIYTVPLVGELKLFEMPVAGFFGFLPFALECFVLKEAVLLLWDAPRRPRLLRPGLALLGLLFTLTAFWGIDLFTVLGFKR